MSKIKNQEDVLVPARYIHCILLFIGLTVAFAMRVNMSVAVVAMTDKESTNPDFPEYKWNEQIKSYVLSSFFIGYICTQIPAGYLATKVGTKINILIAVFISSVASLFIPYGAAWGDWQLVMVLRVIAGIAQGLIIPSTHSLLSHWAPKEERSVMGIYVYSGTQMGVVVMLATSGYLASSSLGWPSVFYIPGILGILWCILFYVFGASTPGECKLIGPAEKQMIADSLADADNGTEKLKFPIKSVLTSRPFLVLMLCHCSYTWGFWTLLTQIPNYMKNVFKFNIKSNALLSSLPYAMKMLLGFLFSVICKIITKHNLMSLQNSRRTFNTIGMWVPALLLVLLGYVDSGHYIIAIVMLISMVGLNSAVYLGFVVNHMDLSPNFAGMLMGITNFAANIQSILAPLVVGRVVTDVTDISQWRIVFNIAAAFYIIGGLFFIFFGRFEIQPWNYAYKEAKSMPMPLDEVNVNLNNENEINKNSTDKSIN